MKRAGLFVLAMLLVPMLSYSQEKIKKVKVYKTWVEKIDGTVIKGYLHSAQPDGLTVNTQKDLDAPVLVVVDPRKISKIRLRRRGQVLIGTGAEFLVGTVMGGILNQEGSWVDTTGIISFSGASLGVLGAGLGAMATAGKQEILIYSSLEIYTEQLPRLQEYSYTAE